MITPRALAKKLSRDGPARILIAAPQRSRERSIWGERATPPGEVLGEPATGVLAASTAARREQLAQLTKRAELNDAPIFWPATAPPPALAVLGPIALAAEPMAHAHKVFERLKSSGAQARE